MFKICRVCEKERERDRERCEIKLSGHEQSTNDYNGSKWGPIRDERSVSLPLRFIHTYTQGQSDLDK